MDGSRDEYACGNMDDAARIDGGLNGFRVYRNAVPDGTVIQNISHMLLPLLTFLREYAIIIIPL